jgi:hypothetical protein
MFDIEQIPIEDIRNPKGSNQMSTKQKIYWRSVYKSFAYPELSVKPPIDLWYDYPLLGKVDPDGYPVYLSESMLKQIPSSKNENAFALKYVAEAWVAMTEYVSKSRRRDPSLVKKSLYQELDPVSAWISPSSLYAEYMSTNYGVFVDRFLSDAKTKQIITFNDFVKEFLFFIDATATLYPFTKEGWLTSYFCPQSVGGTMIEISDADKGEDAEKSKYFKDTYFRFMSDAADKFGFIMDKNAPWRFVADLNSAPMIRRYSADGYSEKTLFQQKYKRLYLEEVPLFFHYLWAWYAELFVYNQTVQQEYLDECSGGTKIKLKKRTLISKVDAWKSFPQEYWMRMYVYVRAKELRKQWNQAGFEKVVGRTLEYFKYKDGDFAFRYLHRQLHSGLDINRLYLKENLTEEEKSAIMLKRQFRSFSKNNFSF